MHYSKHFCLSLFFLFPITIPGLVIQFAIRVVLMFHVAITTTLAVAAVTHLIEVASKPHRFSSPCFSCRKMDSFLLRSSDAYNLRPSMGRSSIDNSTVISPCRISKIPRRRSSRIAKRRRLPEWPQDLQYSSPTGLYNLQNYYYRRALLQCLLHLPSFHNYITSINCGCEKQISECVVCALQWLALVYWINRRPLNFSEDPDGSYVDFLDKAVKKASYQDADLEVQGDPHEFFLFLCNQLEAQQSGSESFDRLFRMHHSICWKCKDCGTEQHRPTSELGMTLAISRHHGRFEAPSLMDYIHDYHVDHVEWQCDSDDCGSARQVGREAGQERIPALKRIKRRSVITQAPGILCIELKRSGFDHSTCQPFKTSGDVEYPE